LYKNVHYKFSAEENLIEFIANPEKYIPEYGGYCAYAIATKGKKVSVNPKSFEIIDNKLYLFYNSWGIDTLEKWNNEHPNKLIAKANNNWNKILEKKK
jgi:hypothetical protein